MKSSSRHEKANHVHVITENSVMITLSYVFLDNEQSKTSVQQQQQQWKQKFHRCYRPACIVWARRAQLSRRDGPVCQGNYSQTDAWLFRDQNQPHHRQDVALKAPFRRAWRFQFTFFSLFAAKIRFQKIFFVQIKSHFGLKSSQITLRNIFLKLFSFPSRCKFNLDISVREEKKHY